MRIVLVVLVLLMLLYLALRWFRAKQVNSLARSLIPNTPQVSEDGCISFDPPEANDAYNDDRFRSHNNCYSYAFNDFQVTATGKVQPGELSGLLPLEEEDYTCENFKRRILLDFPETIIKSIHDTSPCPCGYHKAFLALDSAGDFRDYHFYKQRAGNIWTHKPGTKKVEYVDYSGNIITDPLTADRQHNIDLDINYATPCFYLCVKGRQFTSSRK